MQQRQALVLSLSFRMELLGASNVALHTGGVTGSIPVAPTIFFKDLRLRMLMVRLLPHDIPTFF